MSYFKPTLVGFNEAPPSDDGAQTAANRVDWSKHISKIGTPLRTYIDAVNNAADLAFQAQDPLTTTEWTPSTYEGFSVNAAVTFRYKIVPNPIFGSAVVTMRVAFSEFGTTNGGAIILRTLPANIRPQVGRIVAIPVQIQTAGFGNMRAMSQAIIWPDGRIEIWNPVNVTDGANTYPRHVQANISGRTFAIDNSANFSYEI
jgi:hypothetical protein